MDQDPRARRRPVIRMTLFTMGILGLLFFTFFLVTQRTRTIYYIRASSLNVREDPSLTASSSFRLRRGDHVFYQGEREEQDGLVWIRVFFLYRSENAHLDERMDGWIAEKGLKRTFAEKEPNPFKKILVFRSLVKWKTRSFLHHRIKRSGLLTFIRFLVPFPADKILHVLFMFLLGSFLFVFFLCLQGSL